MPSSRGSSQSGDETQVSFIAGRFFTIQATREALLMVERNTDNGRVKDVQQADKRGIFGYRRFMPDPSKCHTNTVNFDNV